MPDHPDPPLRVLALNADGKMLWWVNTYFDFFETENLCRNAARMEVVDDPRNDPAAVRLIEEAHRA